MSVRTVEQTTQNELLPYMHPELAHTRAVEMAPNLTVPKGTLLGKIMASGKYAAYNDANSNGTEVADVWARYSFVTDADGRVHYGVDVPTTGANSYPEATAEVYFTGIFLPADLVGLNAAAKVDLNSRDMAGGTLIYIP